MPDSLTVLLIVAAIAVIYFFCIRPMRRSERGTVGENQLDLERSREIAELREELRILRAEEALDTDDSSNSGELPPADSR